MKNLLIGLIFSLLIVTMTACGQIGAKNYGGEYTINLPKGEKLVNVTWKDADIWYLTRPMTDKDVAETYKFQEDSTFNVMEGTVTIVESKNQD